MSSFPAQHQGPGAPAAPRAAARAGPRIDTLPPWTYSHPEFLELEKEHVFRRCWLLVGHQCELPAPGDYVTLDAADERVLVIRGRDGRLRALHNVCRHRASRVVSGTRGHCARAITCPYHGWTYDLDGRLRGVPDEKSFGDLDKRRYPLPPVELDLWQGLMFVRIRPGPQPPVSELMRRFDAELAPYRLEALEPYERGWQHPMDVNWKCVHDNDNEGYHVPVGHPGLQRLFGASYGDRAFEGGISRSDSRLQEKLSPVWSERLYQRLLPEVEHLPPEQRRAWHYYGLFPNTSIGVYPDLVEFFQAFPLDTGRSLIRGASYALPDGRRSMRAARWLNRRINRQVWREDLAFCHWSHGGLRSSSYAGGPISERELGVRQFHDRIRALLPVSRLSEPPPTGSLARCNAALAPGG